MDKYLQRRIAKAQNIPAEDVTIAAVTPLEDGNKVLVSGTIRSSANGQYNTSIHFDIVSERLVEAACTCEDCGETQLPEIDGVRPAVDFCKHVARMVLSWRDGGAKLALPIADEDEQADLDAEHNLARQMSEMGMEYG